MAETAAETEVSEFIRDFLETNTGRFPCGNRCVK